MDHLVDPDTPFAARAFGKIGNGSVLYKFIRGIGIGEVKEHAVDVGFRALPKRAFIDEVIQIIYTR